MLTTLRVVDRDSRSPIEGASVLRHSPGSRTLRGADAVPVGISDSAGRLEFVMDDRCTLCVRGDDYAPRLLEVHPGGHFDVELDRGWTLTVSCSAAGLPIPDGLVVMSQTELPPISWALAADLNSSMPGPGDAAVHCGRTDPSGVVRIHGLAAGTYYVDAYLRGYAPVKRRPGGVLRIPGDARLELEFERMMAVLPAVVGDEVIAGSIVARGGGPTYTGTARYLSAERERLLRAYPQSMDATVLLESSLEGPWFDEEGGTLPTAELSVTVLGKHAGLRRFRMAPIPVLELDGPTSLDLGRIRDEAPGTATVSLTVLDADGVDVSDAFDGRFQLLIGNDLRITLRKGANLVPAGAHELISVDARWDGRFSPRTVEAPASIAIRMESAVQPVRLGVTDAAGVQYHRYRLALDNSGRRTAHFVFDAQGNSMPLGIGPVEVELHVRGFAPGTRSFQVERREGIQELDCVVVRP